MCVTGAVVIFRQPALLWSSGGIRGTPQGFLAGCGSWGITGVADILATWYCRSSRTWSLDSVAGINTAPPSSTYQVWGMVRVAFAQGRGSSALPFSCVWALGVRKTATNEIHTGIHNIYQVYIYTWCGVCPCRCLVCPFHVVSEPCEPIRSSWATLGLSDGTSSLLYWTIFMAYQNRVDQS